MAIRILPYRQGSASARSLASAVGGRVLRLVGSTFTPSSRDTIINWGNTNPGCVPPGAGVVVNPPEAVVRASNKKTFFTLMRDAGLDEVIPRFWFNRADIPDDAFPVVCRTVLAGHSGDGIVIANNRNELVSCSLYVKYEKKKDEYRVHVGRTYDDRETAVIAVQRKARRTDFPNPNWQVRNHANGFVYAREGVVPPECVVDAARRALMVSGLDFGAVDVIYNADKERPYVLEINTAPGLEGQTVLDYANFFTS